MRKIIFWGLCLALVLSGAPALADTATLIASGDTYVDESVSNLFTNFSTADTLKVQGVQLGMADKRAYLTFDLSSIPGNYNITGATLKMYVTNVSGAYPETVNYIANSYNLNTATVTWASQLDCVPQLLASADTPATGNWETWNLLPAWNPATDQTNGKLSLVIMTDELNFTLNTYSSCEGDPNYRPQLELTYTDPPAVPIPGTVMLLGSGLLGLIGLGWRRKKS